MDVNFKIILTFLGVVIIVIENVTCFYTDTGCTKEAVQCDKTRCIPQQWFCDLENDCIDGTDEANCTYTVQCNSYEFRCGNGKCIHKVWHCDGDNDCPNGKDEEDCDTEKPCKANEFQCDGDKCLLLWQVCDGINDCQDNKDELRCNNERKGLPSSTNVTETTSIPCQSSEFRCASGQCIPQSLICNGIKDCPDDSDEFKCEKDVTLNSTAAVSVTCPADSSLCTINNKCISNKWICDGESDCLDGSDEANCTSVAMNCEQGHWKCRNGKCILSHWRCDGDLDCQDRSDEENCTKPDTGTAKKKCLLAQYQCHDHSGCVDFHTICDGIADCTDGSDEKDCEFSCESLLPLHSTFSPQDKTNPTRINSKNVHLHSKNTSWCIKNSVDNNWLDIDLGEMKIIRQLVTLGHPVGTEPGSSGFTLKVSYDKNTWYDYTENNKIRVFPGNEVPGKRSYSPLPRFIKVRYLKVIVKPSRNEIWSCMRIGILGCQGETKPLLQVSSGIELKRNNLHASSVTCIASGQQGFNFSWDYFDSKWISVDKQKEVFNYKIKTLTSVGNIWKRIESNMSLNYNRDFILSSFLCHLKGDSVLCSTMIKCNCQYNHEKANIGPKVTKEINIRTDPFKLPSRPKNIVVKSVSSTRVIIAWNIDSFGDFPPSPCSVLYNEIGKSGSNIVYAKMNSQVTLSSLKPNVLYHVQVAIHTPAMINNNIRGIKDYLVVSDAEQFSIFSDGKPSISVISVDTHSAAIQIEQHFPLSLSKNIGGFIVSYQRIQIGPNAVQDKEHKKKFFQKSTKVKLGSMKPWSKYVVTAAPLIITNDKLDVGNYSHPIYINTLTDRPSGFPLNVSTVQKKPNQLAISWLPPLLEERNGEIAGYKIRIGGLREGETTKRKQSRFRTWSISSAKLSEFLSLDEDLDFCTVEVAASNNKGTGIFTSPISIVLRSSLKGKQQKQYSSSVEKRSDDGSNKSLIPGIITTTVVIFILIVVIIIMAAKILKNKAARLLKKKKMIYKHSDHEPFVTTEELQEFSNSRFCKL